MKKKILLPILLLATMSLGGGLIGCDKKPAKSTDSAQSQYKVAIDNKAALEGEWYEGDAKDLELTLTPEANALQELNNKNLTVTSSDETVVKVTGLGLSALKEGTAKITVDYRGAKEEVNVTILSKSAKKKYGASHEGTAEDPFTNEDALLVAKSEKYGGEVYYVKGIIDRFYYAPGTNEKNGVAYYLKAATEGGEQFEVFKCFKADGSQLTDDDIWAGGEATAYGAFTKYNSQYETSSAVFVSCTGTKPQPRQTLTKTFAETLAAGVALADGDSTWDYYKFQGYVTAKSGNDFFLTATKGEALTPGKSDAAHGERDIKGTNAIELFGAGKVEALVAKLLEGAKVEVTMIVKNYHGTVENGADLKDADVTVVEAGQAWAVPEPAVSTKTVTEFIALENNKKNAYKVTATIKAFKNADEKDKYGNMTITDGTTDLAIYGSSATATALAWDNAEAYAFTNPEDFLTNDVTKDLKVGDKIVMKLVRADYTKDGNTTIQGTGVILEVIAPDAPATKTVEITAANLLGYSGTNVAYAADVKPVTIDGLAIASSGCGCYGDGIQMRTNSTTGTSMIYNTAEADLNKLDFTWAATKDVSDKNYHIYVEFSNKADFSELVGEKQSVKFDATSKLAEAVPTAAAKFFRISHANQGGVYMDKVEVVINEGSTPAPAAPVKTWDAAAIKSAISGGTATEVTGHYEAGGTDTFTAYKIGTANMAITLNVNSESAQHVKLQLQLTTKHTNASKCGFWWQLPNGKSALEDVVQKSKIELGGVALPVPEEKSLNYTNFASFNPVESPDAKDSGSALSNPVWAEVIEMDLAQGENTIKITYLDGGYSYWVAGAKLVK